MENIENMSFEAQERLVKSLGNIYRKCRRRVDLKGYYGMIKENRREYDDDRAYMYCIDSALSECSEGTRHIITHDYLMAVQPRWYLAYYSKSRYYRLKKEAITEFLHCLDL